MLTIVNHHVSLGYTLRTRFLGDSNAPPTQMSLMISELYLSMFLCNRHGAVQWLCSPKNNRPLSLELGWNEKGRTKRVPETWAPGLLAMAASGY